MKAIMIMFDSLNGIFFPTMAAAGPSCHNFSAWLKRLLLLTVSMAKHALYARTQRIAHRALQFSSLILVPYATV